MLNVKGEMGWQFVCLLELRSDLGYCIVDAS